MKKILCILSAVAVLMVSGCSSEPSEAPLFEKYVAEGTKYPVKIVWNEKNDGLIENETISVTSTYYIASPDKFYISYDFGEEAFDSLYSNGVLYNIMHEEKTAFTSAFSEDDEAAAGDISIGYIPTEPEKWVLTEKGEAQYEGKTYLYETASLDNKHFLTLYADPDTDNIRYVSYGQGGEMAEFVEISHSFDLRIFEIPEGYEIVNMPAYSS